MKLSAASHKRSTQEENSLFLHNYEIIISCTSLLTSVLPADSIAYTAASGEPPDGLPALGPRPMAWNHRQRSSVRWLGLHCTIISNLVNRIVKNTSCWCFTGCIRRLLYSKHPLERIFEWSQIFQSCFVHCASPVRLYHKIFVEIGTPLLLDVAGKLLAWMSLTSWLPHWCVPDFSVLILHVYWPIQRRWCMWHLVCSNLFVFLVWFFLCASFLRVYHFPSQPWNHDNQLQVSWNLIQESDINSMSHHWYVHPTFGFRISRRCWSSRWRASIKCSTKR